MASTDQEGFSFPIIITETHPLYIDSPPLWHSPSPNHFSCNKLPKEEYYKQRKSCSNIDTEDEDGANMDILWEDYFNEQVSKLEAKKRNNNINLSAAGDMVELGCVQSLKLSKNGNDAIFSAAKKPPTIVMFIKVLKKLLLLHNSSHHNHRSVKNNKGC